MSSPKPFLDGAEQLYLSGLGSPLPSAVPFQKEPPVYGYTGRYPDPKISDLTAWGTTHPDSNLFLRVAPLVIGIDVDGYDDKQGAITLTRLEQTHGSLPPTYRSTARPDDEISGIRYYRLRDWMDQKKMRDPGLHVEIIRHGHRYACVPPSWNPSAGAYYKWYPSLPHLNDLPIISTEWYTHLVRGCACFELERATHKHQMTRHANRKAGGAGRDDALKDLEAACNSLSDMSRGDRNNFLSGIAGRTYLFDALMHSVVTVTEVTDKMTAAALESGLEPHETQRTLESALEWAERMEKE